MPITMSGMASGMDTDSIIDKLVNVEARPIKLLELQKKNFNARKDVLKSLGKFLDDINGTAKELYGFRASFTDKRVASSDGSVLDATASKSADKGVKKIKIIQIASSHKISTDSIQENEILPAGTFTIEVNGTNTTIHFKGGKLKDLNERITEKAADIVSSTYVRKSGDAYILTLESLKSGEKNEIKLSGDNNLLNKIGIIDGEKKDRKSETSLSFDQRYFVSYGGEKKVEPENGSISVRDNGKSVSIRGALWREYVLPVEIAVKNDTTLEFELAYRDQKSADDMSAPNRLKIGPKEKVNIKGIVLEGYNIERKRDKKKDESREFDSIMGIGVVTEDNGKRFEKIYPVEKDARNSQVLAIGKDLKKAKIHKVVVYCNRGTMDISNVRITTPIEKKGGYELKNSIIPPQDAKISVDGVEVTRDRNNDLNDVIKGVTLNLKRASQHEIDLTIEHNIDSTLEKIRKFVDAYNKYIDFHKDITKAAMGHKPGDYSKTLSQSGLFVGDTSLTRLENILKTTVGAAYPNNADRPIKMLSQMGITTGAVNAEWESIKTGKLIIDENQLKKIILENPEGVSMFFGSDGDGDDKADNGMAVKVCYILKPYVTPGKNIISAKIELEDNSIKMADENIKAKEEHLKAYEDKLKRKFAQMERAITQTNSQKQWMKYQLGEGGNESGGKEK